MSERAAGPEPAYVAQSAGHSAAGNAETGQAMYTKAGCETCHGTNGQGTAAGPRLAGTARQTAGVHRIRQKAHRHHAAAGHAGGLGPGADRHLRFPALGTASQAAPAPSAPAGRADAGAALYAKIGCYQCHANQAQGGPQDRASDPDPIPFARFSQYIRNPTGDMPPYTDKVLSNQELADIYAFLQARPRPPAVDTIPQLAP